MGRREGERTYLTTEIPRDTLHRNIRLSILSCDSYLKRKRRSKSERCCEFEIEIRNNGQNAMQRECVNAQAVSFLFFCSAVRWWQETADICIHICASRVG